MIVERYLSMMLDEDEVRKAMRMIQQDTAAKDAEIAALRQELRDQVSENRYLGQDVARLQECQVRAGKEMEALRDGITQALAKLLLAPLSAIQHLETAIKGEG